MASGPLVSLILCVKNGMPYLPAALASVAAQSYRHFELIVQDGGSTDGTLEALRAVRGIPEVQIESGPDGGIGDAYNRAVRRCSGRIVGSIDADNVLEKDALAWIADAFERHPGCAAVYGASAMIDETGRRYDVFVPEPFDLLRVLCCELVPPFAASFFARDVCGDELRFDERLATCADFDLWLRISHLPIVMTPRVLGSTRVSEKSMTRRAERYGRFCEDKKSAVERYLARCGANLPVEDALGRAVAGIYLWAAESVYGLEGLTDGVRCFSERAASLDPDSERLERLRERMTEEAPGRRDSIPEAPLLRECTEERRAMHPLAQRVVAHPLFSQFAFHPLAGQIVDGCQYLWDGSRLTVPWASEETMAIVRAVKGLPEPVEVDQFMRLASRLAASKLTLYEMGAGGGIYSLYASKICPSARFVLVEAHDFLYEVTKKNMDIKGLKDSSVIIHAAISDRPGRIVRFSDDMHGSAISAEGRSYVVTSTIDTIIQNLGDCRVDILHMDVQGEELKALMGCSASFRRGIVKNVFVASHSDELHQECIRFLQGHHFEIVFSQPTSEAEAGYDGIIVATLSRESGKGAEE